MPYIDTKKVKEIRDKVKNEFPEIKFSVRRKHYSSILVALVESAAPYTKEINGEYVQINHFYIDEHYQYNKQLKAVLSRIDKIMNNDNRELVYDSDYGSVPHYYTSIHIGKWNEPFKYIGN